MDTSDMDNSTSNFEPSQVPLFSDGEWSGSADSPFSGVSGVTASNSSQSSETPISPNRALRNSPSNERASYSLLSQGRDQDDEFRARDMVYEGWLLRRLAELRRMYAGESREAIQDIQATVIDALEDWIMHLGGGEV